MVPKIPLTEDQIQIIKARGPYIADANTPPVNWRQVIDLYARLHAQQVWSSAHRIALGGHRHERALAVLKDMGLIVAKGNTFYRQGEEPAKAAKAAKSAKVDEADKAGKAGKTT